MSCRSGVSTYDFHVVNGVEYAIAVPKTANLYNGSPSITDGQRWDSWGRFTSYLFATVPHQSINGALDAYRYLAIEWAPD